MRRIPVEQRRDELVDAAVRVIARDGLTAVTARAVVAEAGMPLGSLHYAFASLDELLSSVIERVTDAERIAAVQTVETQHAPALGRHPALAEILDSGMGAYLDVLVAAPQNELALLEVALSALRRGPEAVQAQWATYRAAAADSMRRAAAMAHVAWQVPVDEVAYRLVAALDGVTLTWLVDRDTPAARRHITFLAQALATLADLPSTTPATFPATTAPARTEIPASRQGDDDADHH